AGVSIGIASAHAQDAPPARAQDVLSGPGTALVTRLFDALNSKDAAKIEAFVRADCADVPSPAERAARMAKFAAQGAPFKVIRLASASTTAVTGLVENKSSEQFSFVLGLAGTEAAPKMTTLRLGDPEDLDAKPPRDYTGWKDLHSLAASVRTDTESPAIGIA